MAPPTQCEKSALCSRGFDHHGFGGPCNRMRARGRPAQQAEQQQESTFFANVTRAPAPAAAALAAVPRRCAKAAHCIRGYRHSGRCSRPPLAAGVVPAPAKAAADADGLTSDTSEYSL